MSSTPRTDAAYLSGCYALHSASEEGKFARALEYELSAAQARIAELERERDEALQLAGGPSTLREVANECTRARMQEQALERERDALRAALKKANRE